MTLSDLAKYAMTRSIAGLTATVELLAPSVCVCVFAYAYIDLVETRHTRPCSSSSYLGSKSSVWTRNTPTFSFYASYPRNVHGLKSLTLFVNSTIHNALQLWGVTVNQALPQVGHISNWRLIHSTLHASRHTFDSQPD